MSKDLNNYRLDIDGIRAIAVISVILYHLEFAYGENVLFTGGFTGVDIFFVISGYVITSSIAGRENKSLIEFASNFYEKRVKRLHHVPV